MTPINIAEKYNKINQYWTPKIIGELNGQYVKLAKVKDELIWHSHENEDELFLIFKGTLLMDFRDKTVEVQEGEILIVPKGVEHRPRDQWRRSAYFVIRTQGNKAYRYHRTRKNSKNARVDIKPARATFLPMRQYCFELYG